MWPPPPDLRIKASQRQAKRMQKIRVKNFSRMPQPVDQVCLRFVCIMTKNIYRCICDYHMHHL